jgi:uncharacterized protein YbcV (DUF1398 family)
MNFWVIFDLTIKIMMFTLDQITFAHSRVNSGADFPQYIRDLKTLGVVHYIAFVEDGHVDYYGTHQHVVQAPGKYDALVLSESLREDVFKEELLAHQLGKTDYPTFVRMCAETGISTWEVNIEKLTCTYFDIEGNLVLTEQIPI